LVLGAHLRKIGWRAEGCGQRAVGRAQRAESREQFTLCSLPTALCHESLLPEMPLNAYSANSD